MDEKTSYALIAVVLIVGIIGGFYFDAEVVCDECEEVPQCEVCISEVCKVPVDYLTMAKDDFLKELDDNDDLQCDRDEYDIDEVSVSKIYDGHSLTFDDEDVTVEFEIKLKFDEDSEKSCRDKYEVEVFYEEGESPEIDY